MFSRFSNTRKNFSLVIPHSSLMRALVLVELLGDFLDELLLVLWGDLDI
jgi:hypothetical protein